MTQIELNNMWNYYLSLEEDLSATSRFIEPSGQEDTYSFEFSKLIVLSCTEIESVFKAICKAITGKEGGSISDYKGAILKAYPKIIGAVVFIPRWSKEIKPFSGWKNGKLAWWKAYSEIKHNRGSSFQDATYENAVYALSALYILILYLGKINDLRVEAGVSKYILSAYAFRYIVNSPMRQLPDFEEDNSAPVNGGMSETAKIYMQAKEPREAREGDIWIKSEEP